MVSHGILEGISLRADSGTPVMTYSGVRKGGAFIVVLVKARGRGERGGGRPLQRAYSPVRRGAHLLYPVLVTGYHITQTNTVNKVDIQVVYLGDTAR